MLCSESEADDDGDGLYLLSAVPVTASALVGMTTRRGREAVVEAGVASMPCGGGGPEEGIAGMSIAKELPCPSLTSPKESGPGAEASAVL